METETKSQVVVLVIARKSNGGRGVIGQVRRKVRNITYGHRFGPDNCSQELTGEIQVKKKTVNVSGHLHTAQTLDDVIWKLDIS